MKGNEMGKVRIIHGREEKCVQNFGKKPWSEETTKETLTGGRKY
jgi:hypothetical protein